MPDRNSLARRAAPFLLSALLLLPGAARCEIEWTDAKQLDLDAAPLDMVSSTDGKWIIVLTRGALLIYSAAEGKVIDRHTVDPAFDKLVYSPADDAVVLSSSIGKQLKFVKIDEIFTFSLTDRYVKGPLNAPVTVTVFSDYQ